MLKLDSLLKKDNRSDEELTELKTTQLELDKLYTDLAKGSFIRSRAKWTEEGEKNSSYFFALEKRNYKRKSLSALNINNTLCKDPAQISDFISLFYENLYKSEFQEDRCETFLQQVRNYVPIITDDFKTLCDAELTTTELNNALKSMKRNKAPGIDGLPVEFYVHFWNLLEKPIFNLFKECLRKEEMVTTMKQGVISLIPKSGKDPQYIDNWRPISLLTTEYKLLALIFANRLKKYLDHLINETQTGFMKGRHISCNIRLALDLIDYAESFDSDAVILFLDFCKAFDTVEHRFLFDSLEMFGFGSNFISAIKMLYKDINSSIIINHNTSKRFCIHRGVRQGCPISPFLFILVVELMSISILNNTLMKGISIFNKEIRISQLADDTTLFLKDKDQIPFALKSIEYFSQASGLYLNLKKCEILCLHKSNDQVICGIPVKDSVKYLGIHICKNQIIRQNLNFLPRLNLTKSILNNWLQRDLSIIGRVLLSKAEGLSRFVYPALSLYSSDSTCKTINDTFLNFIWRNKQHRLKKSVLSNNRSEGGLEVINFIDINNTFKINWLRRCLLNGEDSLWYFIPCNIFKKCGGLQFLLKCNYSPSRLPLKMSNFYRQALLAWNLLYVHNFSPHKTLLWNNKDITIKNESIFLPSWHSKGISFIIDLFDKHGNLLSYNDFISSFEFPIRFKEFSLVCQAIPSGTIHTVDEISSFTQHKCKN